VTGVQTCALPISKYSAEWPNISTKGEAPADADEFKDVKDKLEKYFSPEPGTGG
jgi:ferredoxin